MDTILKAIKYFFQITFSHKVEEVRERTHHYVVRTIGDELELVLLIGGLVHPNASNAISLGRTVKVRIMRMVSSVEEARDIVRAELERYEKSVPTV